MFTACGIIHPRCCRPVTLRVYYTTSCNTQSSAPEDGRDHRSKHVELTGIINKPLLLHLFDCLYYFLYHFACPFKPVRLFENKCFIDRTNGITWNSLQDKL